MIFMEYKGERFVHSKNGRVHLLDVVEHEYDRLKQRGESPSEKPWEKIKNWLKVIKKTHNGHYDDESVMGRIKDAYHKRYVISPEDIPESYFENQRQLARQRGHGDIDLTREMKNELIEVIVSDQKSTLNTWVDYFCSPDSSSLPMWAKYWAFTGMTKLAGYDKEKGEFRKRAKNTTAPFSELNREALALAVDSVIKYVENDEINEDMNDIVKGGSFGKLYELAIKKTIPSSQVDLEKTVGEWVKYNQGSDYNSLVSSLGGHGTGWCTVAENTAKMQLQGGDFYVFYSLDDNNDPTIPRVAIRMEENNIAEIRGIAKEQNLDSQIVSVVDEKLKEFGGEGEKYKKKIFSMQRLTEIEKKESLEENLTEEDLRFLYEIDGEIIGFGYSEDPRIEEIRSRRNKRGDLSNILNISESEISITKEEALKEGIKYHYGGLNLESLTSAEGLRLPETISGYLNLVSLTSAEGLKLPETISGYLNLISLTSAEGLKLPGTIGGGLYLESLTSADGLKLPGTIGGGLYLRSLTSADGLKLPGTISGDLYLESLTSADGLKLPETIGGDLYLRSLTSAEGLKLPEIIGGYLDLGSLTSAEGLRLPETIGGYLDLISLTSAEGLRLPETIGGGLYLESLTSADGLTFPGTIGGGLYFRSLTSADGLKLPGTIGGDLNLESLTSAEGLRLPETISGYLNLGSLTSAEGLRLPETISGYLNLGSLTSTEGLKLPETISGDLYLSSLTSAELEKIRIERPDLRVI
jgi:hypothetical protein